MAYNRPSAPGLIHAISSPILKRKVSEDSKTKIGKRGGKGTRLGEEKEAIGRKERRAEEEQVEEREEEGGTTYVWTVQPGRVGTSIAKFVFPQAEGNPAAI
jgi:hypothetical protein